MNKIKSLIFATLCSIAFHNFYASEQKTFTTAEEKIRLCKSLGAEYSHEVTVSSELRRSLIALGITAASQKLFKGHPYYQECVVENPSTYRKVAQDRSATNNMIIKKVSKEVGYGVIAGKKFKNGDRLGLYAGELKIKPSSTYDGDYTFACGSIIPNCPELIIDARHKRNELGFINGSQHHSNCEARNFLVPTGEKRLIYIATQDIEIGQEILADYGDSYWSSHRRSQYQELGKKSTLGKGFEKGFLTK